MGNGTVRRAASYGAWPLFALAATVALDSGERQSLSLAVNGIQHQFHVSDTAVGLLPFAMAVVGILGSPPFGYLADHARRVLLLAGGVVAWTVCMALNAIAGSYVMLFAFRMGVGGMEANGPAAISLISDYWPPAVRAKKMGLYQAGALVGAIVGLGLGGVVVGIGGWRWAFLMWIPFGVAVAVLVARQPEPERGCQDGAWDEPAPTGPAPTGSGAIDVDGLAGLPVEGLPGLPVEGLPGVPVEGLAGVPVAALPVTLPAPTRTATCHYPTATSREVFRELRAARSMWFGVMAITIAQLLLNGLQFWAVPYFERVDGLGAPAAGGFAATLALGAVVGILGGGVLADRLLRRGILNARVFVVAGGSIAGTAVLFPAFASTHIWVTAPLLVVGGAVLTLPVAPAEALMTDVVVAELRGRAAAIRSIVRSLSSVGALIVGALSTTLISTLGVSRADGLRWALVALTPVYAIGGLLMLFAARHYPADVAFVAAEARRRNGEGTEASR
jgi:MFS family permease